MIPSKTLSSYDEIPYPGQLYPQTHPDLMAAIGILSGMVPPPIDSCRVLEVGCGDASNIIAMAITLPNAEFVGIDLAELPIRQAQVLLESIAITNVRVRAMDLLDLTPDLGHFDYIIAHGFYSWVPSSVQDKLFKVCRQHLSPNGIAFISYNTYPAAHFRRASRDMMLFHLKKAGVRTNDVDEAKSMLNFVADTIEDRDTWKAVVRDEFNRIDKRNNNVIYHDELNQIYSPVYFEDFVASAAGHGLQFLGEASLDETMSYPLNPELEQRLTQLAAGDLIVYEQYLDFIRFRGFRRTLLCHVAVPLQKDQRRERLPSLLLASPLRETSRKADGKVTFKKQHGRGSVETDHTVMIALLQRLEQIWPNAESFDSLLAHLQTQVLGQSKDDLRSILIDSLVSLIANQLVQCRTRDLPVPKNIASRPIASALARKQAETGTPLTTLLHTHIEIEDQRTRDFLRLLDGSHDHRALAAWLRAGAKSDSLDEMLKEVTKDLKELRRLGLLVIK